MASTPNNVSSASRPLEHGDRAERGHGTGKGMGREDLGVAGDAQLLRSAFCGPQQPGRCRAEHARDAQQRGHRHVPAPTLDAAHVGSIELDLERELLLGHPEPLALAPQGMAQSGKVGSGSGGLTHAGTVPPCRLEDHGL